MVALANKAWTSTHTTPFRWLFQPHLAVQRLQSLTWVGRAWSRGAAFRSRPSPAQQAQACLPIEVVSNLRLSATDPDTSTHTSVGFASAEPKGRTRVLTSRDYLIQLSPLRRAEQGPRRSHRSGSLQAQVRSRQPVSNDSVVLLASPQRYLQ